MIFTDYQSILDYELTDDFLKPYIDLDRSEAREGEYLTITLRPWVKGRDHTYNSIRFTESNRGIDFDDYEYSIDGAKWKGSGPPELDFGYSDRIGRPIPSSATEPGSNRFTIDGFNWVTITLKIKEDALTEGDEVKRLEFYQHIGGNKDFNSFQDAV